MHPVALQTFVQVETERTKTIGTSRAFLRLEEVGGQKRLAIVVEPSFFLCKALLWLDRNYFRKNLYDLEAVKQCIKSMQPNETTTVALQILQGKIQRYNTNHPGMHIRTDDLFPRRILDKSQECEYPQIKKALWQHIDKQGRVFFQMLVRNEGTNSEKAEVFVDTFMECEKITADSELKTELTGTVQQVFDVTTLPTKDRQQKLDETRGLWIYKTHGQGACGFHALFGEYDKADKEYICLDSVVRRGEFCVWLRDNKDHLPEVIKVVLNDYFLHFEYAPSYFKTAEVTEIRNKMLREIQTLTQQDDRDALLDRFMQNNTVFNSYLYNLSQEGTYLLQEELIACALCFKKKLILFQPGLGNDSDQIFQEAFHSEFGDDTAEVYYNGRNHYEKAQEITHNASLTSCATSY